MNDRESMKGLASLQSDFESATQSESGRCRTHLQNSKASGLREDLQTITDRRSSHIFNPARRLVFVSTASQTWHLRRLWQLFFARFALGSFVPLSSFGPAFFHCFRDPSSSCRRHSLAGLPLRCIRAGICTGSYPHRRFESFQRRYRRVESFPLLFQFRQNCVDTHCRSRTSVIVNS
jgi:hypothetical protein